MFIVLLTCQLKSKILEMSNPSHGWFFCYESSKSSYLNLCLHDYEGCETVSASEFACRCAGVSFFVFSVSVCEYLYLNAL